MNPRLIIVAGPRHGAIFDLSDTETSIGREVSNHISLLDPSVSRRHATIHRDGERFKIVDLGSFNGTFVNGVPISESSLEHGDQIAIGDVLLLLLLYDTHDKSGSTSVEFEDYKLQARTTVELRRHDAFYLQEEKVLAALPPTSGVARDLSTLLKISTVLNSTKGFDTIQHRLLDLIFEIVPAERGAILLCQESSEELVLSSTLNKSSRRDELIRVSRMITQQSLSNRSAILSNNVGRGGSTAEASESLIAAEVTALLCVPLILFEEPLGLIYLDTRDPTTSFDEHHLQLLTAVANMAAVALEGAQRVVQLESEKSRINRELNLKHKMIGESRPMCELYQMIARVAPTDSTVLILGESGTGKELAARAIHSNSLRAEKPFIAINCATLTEQLLESELFGHEKGAFTGAITPKKGKLEIADGGTIFLDEVGELAASIQAKLLRVLQEREFERVGGTRPIKVDIRIIAATNRNLLEATKIGSFRHDLYYRLNIITLTMTPLRERREDIPLLASFFASECSKRSKKKLMRVSAEARACLMNFDWPGNVRELENAIERAVVLGSSEMIMPEDLPQAILETVTISDAPMARFYDLIRETKRQLILNTIEQANGNLADAAKRLGIHPNNLHRLIRNLQLKSLITTRSDMRP